MEFFQVALLLGLVPMIVYTAVLWWLDHWEREPLSLILACFVWGALPAIVLSLVASVLILRIPSVQLIYDPVDLSVLMSVIVAPLTEESFKGLGLLVLLFTLRRNIDSQLDGILYGAAIGFGFAAVENVVYFINFGQESGLALGVLVLTRAFAFGLNHAFYTSLTGLGLALAVLHRNRLLKVVWPLLGLASAMFFHGLHNYLVGRGLGGIGLSFVANLFGVFWVFVIVVVSLVRQGNWMRQYLAEEVDAGVLTALQANTACCFRRRLGQGFNLLGTRVTAKEHERRLGQLCARLALNKRKLRDAMDDDRNRRIVEDLRRELSETSRELEA